MRRVAILGGAALLCGTVAASSSAQTVSPAANPKTTSGKVKATPATEAGAARYREAKALERKGDFLAAVLAYEEAAQAGHGYAQMRLAQIYDNGNPAVKRDYARALRWYEKARAQGLPVPRPHPYVTGR